MAGLYFLSKRFYFYTNKECFKTACKTIKDKIWNCYNSKYPFGFANVEEVGGKTVENNHINLLSGVSNILLLLIDNVNNFNSKTWERIFLVDV